MKIKLKEKIHSYLVHLFHENNNDIENKIKVTKEGCLFYLCIDEDDMNIVRDLALKKMQEVGFDENYKLTNEGEMLEEIIDLFYI